MFVDYDNADTAPGSEQIASSSMGFMESNPWNRAVFTASPAAMYQGKSIKYVTPPSGIPDTADITNYNCGTFYLAAVGVPAIDLGSLWVEYTVELSIPSGGVSAGLDLLYAAHAFFDDLSTPLNDGTDAGTVEISNPAQLLAGVLQDSFQQIAKKIPTIEYDAKTGEITLPGPAVYNISLITEFDPSGTTEWAFASAVPAFADIINVASTGLNALVDLTAYPGFGSAFNQIVSGAFSVTGAVGVLRLAATTAKWYYTKGVAASSYNRQNLLVSAVYPNPVGAPSPDSKDAKHHFMLQEGPFVTNLPPDSKEGKIPYLRPKKYVPRIPPRNCITLKRSSYPKEPQSRSSSRSPGTCIG